MSVFDTHKNLAYSLVATAPSPAASGTSLVVTAAQGTRFPAVPFNATIWPANTIPTPANSEIVRVTAIATDTLTITRTQEGTSARTVIVGDQIAATITAKTLTDVEGAFVTQSFRGLTLRTHPDQDVSASKVQLLHADEIVMDDGGRFATVDRLVADITAAGAGGLDTGAEAASAWYEIYAIAKDDLTKNLLLHRAKDYNLDQSFTTAPDANSSLRVGATNQVKLGQTFQVSTANLKLEFVDVNVIRLGSPTGRVWAEIQDNAGAVLATSDKLDVALFPAARSYIRFVFRTPVSNLATATTYRLALAGDYTASASVNNLQWAQLTTGGYANGTVQTFDGTTWTAVAAADFNFKLYLTRNEAAVTMPSGYTKKCLVGYVYNNGSSNFVGFRAQDRRVYTLKAQDSGAVTSATPLLVDYSAVVPPVPVSICGGVYNATASAYTGIGGVPDGFGVGNYWDYGLAFIYSIVTGATAVTGDIPTEMQAMYLLAGGATAIHHWTAGYTW